MKYIKLTAMLLLTYGMTGVYAQEAVAIGGEASGAGGTASYTVGQVVYTTNTAINGTVAQGVQQPFEISTITGIDVKEINLELSAYPNPTTNSLTLKIGNYHNGKLTYQLYDMQGKLLDYGQVTTISTSITMESLSTSTYFLRISDNNKLVKTFKVVKN